MKRKIDFIKILISDSNDASSRRVIAIAVLPVFIFGILGGLIRGLWTGDINFFSISLGLAAITEYITYFTLTWEHVTNIFNTKLFKKKGDFYDNDLTTDP